MSALSEAIAAELALLTRVVAEPTGNLGYGTDLSCTDDLTDDLEEVDPFSVRAIGEAIYRRLITTRGTLPDDPDYGIDVASYLNHGATNDEINALAGRIRNEVVKDDRVSSATCTVTLEALKTLRITVRITAEDPILGVFTLTMAVQDGKTMLEAIK